MNKNRLFQKYILFDMLASLIVWVAFVVFRKSVNDIQIFDSARIFIPITIILPASFYFPFVVYLYII